MNQEKAPTIPLHNAWRRHVRSAVLHVVSLAQYATVYTRGWAVDSMNGRVRLKAERDRMLQELALEREASRIKDARNATLVAPPITDLRRSNCRRTTANALKTRFRRFDGAAQLPPVALQQTASFR